MLQFLYLPLLGRVLANPPWPKKLQSPGGVSLLMVSTLLCLHKKNFFIKKIFLPIRDVYVDEFSHLSDTNLLNTHIKNETKEGLEVSKIFCIIWKEALCSCDCFLYAFIVIRNSELHSVEYSFWTSYLREEVYQRMWCWSWFLPGLTRQMWSTMVINKTSFNYGYACKTNFSVTKCSLQMKIRWLIG